MEKLNEHLLQAWLRLSTSVVNSRLVSELPYNESLICNVLYNHICSGNQAGLTATELCNETKMAKSLMNRSLNQLENLGIISRVRSVLDKRQVLISLNLDKAGIYLKQHQEILNLLDTVIENIGETASEQAITLFQNISDIADRKFSKFVSLPEEE